MLPLLLAAIALAAPLALAPPREASFRPAAREVSNWRFEAGAGLDLPPVTAALLSLGLEPDAGGLRKRFGEASLLTARCVKMNNYWCIKRAGWAGEIAADAEGHVAFASAAEGALVAAGLLRRYYVDYKRHSAYDIVSRWAPAECGGAVAGRAAAHLAARGIGNTLRARWLARGRRGGGLRRSVVKDRPLLLARAPSIAVGLGERPVALPAIGLARALAAAPLREPVLACGGGPRAASYASAASAGVAADGKADLRLFDAEGMPTDNLARVMLNMAGVEIGPARVREAVVREAVAALARRLRAAAAAKAAGN